MTVASSFSTACAAVHVGESARMPRASAPCYLSRRRRFGTIAMLLIVVFLARCLVGPEIGYCGHGGRNESPHFGHHVDVHVATATTPKGDHHSCEVCHAFHLVAILADVYVQVSPQISRPVLHLPPQPYDSAISPGPDRPRWPSNFA